MKRLAVLLVLLASIGATAQKNDGPRMRRGAKMDLTAEQMATLQTKHMTLALDLSQAQQDKLYTLNLEQAEFRKERREEMQALKESGERPKLSADEKFEKENARLERQIAFQGKMKDILNEEQFETWKKMRMQSKKRAMHGKKKMQERGRRR